MAGANECQKITFAKRKLYVKKILCIKLGMNVDKPKSGGTGTNNEDDTYMI